MEVLVLHLLWVILDVPPLLLIVVLKLPMSEFSLALSQLLLLCRLMELLSSADHRQFAAIFLLVLVLEILQNRVYIVSIASLNSGS